MRLILEDRLYPFTFGRMTGIIIIRAHSSEWTRIIDVLSRLMEFIVSLPFPRAFQLETKCVAACDSVIIRGRDTRTLEVKTLHVVAGRTTHRQIRQFLSFY
jgi:hypothetical protein